MAYIYKISNDFDNNVYVGKTLKTVKERWKEHLYDCKRQRYKNRYLYRAFNKYGIKHFKIEQIEECEDDDASDREIYWISHYDSFHNGYNMTLGGDATHFLDYNKIIETYKQVQNIKTTAKICGCCIDSVSDVLEYHHIPKKTSGEFSKEKNSIPVDMYSLNDDYIRSFSFMQDAARFLVENEYCVCKNKDTFRGIAGHISEAARGGRKTAYKFKWKFKDISNKNNK